MNTNDQDNKLAAEEARRDVQHRTIKSRVEHDVNAELAARLDRTPPAEGRKLEQVAGEFRGKAIDAVVETDRDVERTRGMARVSQIVDYVFCVVYALLGMRLFLGLLAARSGAGFVQFMRAVTDPLYGPFRGILPSPTAEGGYTLAMPIVMAILVYALFHIGVNAFMRLLVHRKTAF
jgi:hypothetical protein